jgi:hypothetical protein
VRPKTAGSAFRLVGLCDDGEAVGDGLGDGFLPGAGHGRYGGGGAVGLEADLLGVERDVLVEAVGFEDGDVDESPELEGVGVGRGWPVAEEDLGAGGGEGGLVGVVGVLVEVGDQEGIGHAVVPWGIRYVRLHAGQS